LALDPLLNVLLVVTGSLQVGALATRIAGRKRVALAMAGTNAALALALTLQDFVVFMRSNQKMDLAEAALLALAVAAAGAAAIGLAMRRESVWLFWPVWLWNFGMIYMLIDLRFFFRVYF
jgi:hypothetical protein